MDWYDKRAAHLDPRDTWDRTNGRIYRVVYGTRRKLEPFDLSKRTSTELVALRTSTNDWFPAEARRILAERRDSSIVPLLRRLLTSDSDEIVALRDLWVLHVSGGLDDPTAMKLLDHPVAGVRRWTVRLLGDDHRMSRDLRAKLETLASVEPDAMVRSQLASSCQRWGAADALSILGRLVRHDEDLRDPHIPNQLWWAFERQLRQDRDAVIELLCGADVPHTPLLRDAVLERVARALASEGSDGDFGACARLLAVARGQDSLVRLLTGMEKGLESRKLAQTPAPLAQPLAQIWAAAQPAPGVVLIRLAARLGSAPAIEAAVSKARDPHAAQSDRLAMIELLGQLGGPNDLPALLEILNRDPSATIQLAAVAALGSYSQPTIAQPLIARYPSLSTTVRARILGLLCTRRPWAGALLDAIERRQIVAKDLSAADVQLVARLSDPALLARLETTWGKIPRVGSPEKKQRIAEIRGLLPEGDKGNATRGKPIFKENCAVCHKLFNEGESIGPDLSGSERGDLDFLMTSLVDPSALVRKEYQSQTIALRDGRVLTGLVIDENDQSLTLVDSNRQKTIIPATPSRKPSRRTPRSCPRDCSTS